MSIVTRATLVSVRLSRAAAAAALASLLVVSPAHGAVFLVLSVESGPPGTEVTGRTGGEGALMLATGAIQTFLVHADAASVTTPDDPRLIAIGQLEVPANGNGTIMFTVPDIEPGAYELMVHCPVCADLSAGRSMLPVGEFEVTSEIACPVTIPNRSRPPPGGGGLGPGSMATHGNGLLWTILPDDGVWRVPESGVRSDGSIRQKFVWWRRVVDQTTTTDTDGVVTAESTYAGSLRITGRRLDADAPPATATTRHEGVHVGSTITFPTGGCWEITGTAGEDILAFTVYMLPPGEAMPDTAIRSSPPVATLGLILLIAGSALAVAKRSPAAPRH